MRYERFVQRPGGSGSVLRCRRHGLPGAVQGPACVGLFLEEAKQQVKAKAKVKMTVGHCEAAVAISGRQPLSASRSLSSTMNKNYELGTWGLSDHGRFDIFSYLNLNLGLDLSLPTKDETTRD